MIGLGRIGWSLEEDPLRYHPCTHAGSLHRLRKPSGKRDFFFMLDGVSDLNPESIHRFMDWWKKPGPVTSSDWKKMLRLTRPKFVIIATPPESHVEIASEAILQGATHILVEKPVARNAREASRLLRLARKKNVSVYVNFERRFHPGYMKIKSLIEGKIPGNGIRSIRGRVLTGSGFDPSSGQGTLFHDAIHWIDLLLWYAGTPKKTEAILRNTYNPLPTESVFLRMEYPEFVASLETSGDRRYFEFEMEIDWKDRRMLIGNEGFRFFTSTGSKRYSGFRELSSGTFSYKKKNPWMLLYEAILNDLGQNRRGNLRMLEDAIEGLRIVDRVYSPI